MKRNRFLSLVLAGIVSLSATGCYFLPDEEEIIEPPTVKTSETSYTTIIAKKKDLVKKIVTSGTIVSQKEQALTFGMGGTIKTIYKKAGDTVKEGDVLAELDTGELDYLIEEKELYIKRCELNMKLLKEQGASQTEIDKEQVQKEIYEHEIITYNEQKENAVIKAPNDGAVISVTAKEGDWVSEEQEVVKTIDPNLVYMEISPDDLTQFKMDMDIQIKLDGEIYEGVVFMIPNEFPEDDEENEYGIEFKSKRVYVKFKDNPPENCVNVLADTILIQDERKDVVVVANNIIKTVNGEKVVYLLKDGKKVAQTVELGLQTGSQTEIVSGINEGDEIVIR